MPWPWRRRATARHAAAPRPATWAEAALPPQASLPEQPDEIVVGEVPAGERVAGGSVRLGFVDGTLVELSPTDPAVSALLAVAEVLAENQQR